MIWVREYKTQFINTYIPKKFSNEISSYICTTEFNGKQRDEKREKRERERPSVAVYVKARLHDHWYLIFATANFVGYICLRDAFYIMSFYVVDKVCISYSGVDHSMQELFSWMPDDTLGKRKNRTSNPVVDHRFSFVYCFGNGTSFTV